VVWRQGYWIDDADDRVILEKCVQHGVDKAMGYAIIAVESAFNRFACGDRVFEWDHIETIDGVKGAVILAPGSPDGFYVAWECTQEPDHYGYSHGMLQLHTGGGQGTGMRRPALIDTAQNLDRGFPPIARAFNDCEPGAQTVRDFVCCVGRWSGHPGWVADCNDYRITNLLNAYDKFTKEFGGGSVLDFMRLLGCATSAPLAALLTGLSLVTGFTLPGRKKDCGCHPT
jgi:hypothetical protein